MRQTLYKLGTHSILEGSCPIDNTSYVIAEMEVCLIYGEAPDQIPYVAVLLDIINKAGILNYNSYGYRHAFY